MREGSFLEKMESGSSRYTSVNHPLPSRRGSERGNQTVIYQQQQREDENVEAQMKIVRATSVLSEDKSSPDIQ